ncbi:MAG TPA: hypothetical protein PK760_16465, partial [Flavobacteriales bacterium]|nr:hypothetical protein [Flavobacteriales bacterium]
DRLIRGLLYSMGLMVSVFMLATLLESLGHFGTAVRSFLFWSTIVAVAVVAARFIVLPTIKLFRLGTIISHEEAARIVGTHFTEVRDKLLNTLQLHEMSGSKQQQHELIEAAIAQRSRELGPVAFVNAIDLRRNTRYLRYALPPLAVLLILLVAAPSLITDPAERLIEHGKDFKPAAPFQFMVVNDTLEVREEEDFELQVDMVGSVLPQQVDLEVGGQHIPMVKQGAARFVHRFRNVRDDIEFKMSAEGFGSDEHVLRVVAHPMVLDFSIAIDYPPYLGLPNETRSNTGDLTVPAGTRLTWNVNARSADGMRFVFDDTTQSVQPLTSSGGTSSFRLARRLL